jgi:hypothetical protein
MNAAAADQRRVIFVIAILCFRPGIDNRDIKRSDACPFFTIHADIFIMQNAWLRSVIYLFHDKITHIT